MTVFQGRRQPQLPEMRGSYADLIMTAHDHMDRAEWEDAAAILQRIVDRVGRLPAQRRRPGSDLAQVLTVAASDLVTAWEQLGKSDEALQLCRQLEAAESQEASYWRRIASSVLIARGEVEEGLAGIRAEAEANPEDIIGWLVLAQQLIIAGHTDGIEEVFARAEALAADENDDAVALVHFNRYHWLRQQGRWPEALLAWEAAVAMNEELEEYRETVVRHFLEAEELDLALRTVDDEALGQPVADYFRARIAHRRGDRVRARYLWRQLAAVDLDRWPDALVVRALAHCWLGEPLKALSGLLHEVRVSRAMRLRHAMVLALAWAMQGNEEGARSNLALASRLVTEESDQELLPRLEWFEFQELVPEGALKAELKTFFALELDPEAG